MSTVPNNILVNVQTYQKAQLAWMLDSYCFLDWSNKAFLNFQDKTAQLGDTVTFELAPQSSLTYGLIVQPQSTIERLQTLACTQAANANASYTDQQLLFNVHQYMKDIGMSRIRRIGSAIEIDVAKNITSSVTVLNPDDPRFGQNISPDSGPYRFFGDGVTPINSFRQLYQMVANFKDYGAADYDFRGVLPITIVPQIIDNGFGSFTPVRNDELARSWVLGEYGDCRWGVSNLLPIHISGTVGNATSPGNILTLISTNDPTGANITQLTLSGATNNDINAIKAGDLMNIQDGTSGLPDMRYLTFMSKNPSGQPVQIRSLTNAPADGSGNVIVNIYPALVSVPGQNQNLNNSLQAGMKFRVIPSHRAGILMSGNPLYLAMPRLPSYEPYPSVQTTDPDTGASIRHYWGSSFGANQRLYVYDQIWGSTMVAENCMRIIIPLTQ